MSNKEEKEEEEKEEEEKEEEKEEKLGSLLKIPILEPISSEPISSEEPSNPPFKINKIVTLIATVIFLAFFFIIETKILQLPFIFRKQLLGPYLQDLHVWIVFIKHIYTFLKTAYPNNALTNIFEKMIIYIVDSIPNEMVRTYVKTAPQTIALRPHIQIALLTFLQSLKTPETELVIEDLTKLAKSVEQLFEIKRILKIDIATSDNLNSGNASYNDLLHIINNYPTRFNQFMDYFNKLINYFLHATSLDLTQANPVFQRVSEMVRIASDFQAGRIISEAFTKTIPNLVKNINAILQAKFAENGPTIEEIDGGKRKTKRQKTNRKQKINKKQKHFSKKQKKQRNTRIVHQKLNKLAKFLLIQTPNQKFRS